MGVSEIALEQKIKVSLIQQSSTATIQLKLSKRDRTRTQNLGGVSEIALEQKRRLPQNKTNIHLFLFNSPVQPPSKLGKKERERERELELGNLGVSEIAMEQKKRLPQNKTFTFSYSTVQYSYHPSLARERERELGNLGVSKIAMELKRRLPQNKTSNHLLFFNSPVQPSFKLGKKRESSNSELGSQ